jgi:hypothetical protein
MEKTNGDRFALPLLPRSALRRRASVALPTAHARSISPATTAAGGFSRSIACTVLNRWLRVPLQLQLQLRLRGGRAWPNIMKQQHWRQR